MVQFSAEGGAYHDSLCGAWSSVVWLARPSHLHAGGDEWEGRSSGSRD